MSDVSPLVPSTSGLWIAPALSPTNSEAGYTTRYVYILATEPDVYLAVQFTAHRYLPQLSNSGH